MKMLRVAVPQPAYKIYAIDRGWRIMNYVVVHLFKYTHEAACWWFNLAKKVQSWASFKPWYLQVWVVLIICGGLSVAGGVQYVVAMLFTALFLGVYALILGLWSLFSALFLGLFTAGTTLYARFYRIFFRCPNCHKDMPIPIYVCPTCRTEHTRLWPSVYGVLTHRCQKCETRLPTGGPKRKRLDCFCQHCHRPLNGWGTNLHIPIVGGPSTGKTNFIMMATHEIKRLYEEKGYTIIFPDTKHQRTFEANLRKLESGQPLLVTPDIVPQAYNLEIKAPRRSVPKLAYIYDAAGEAFHSSENTNSQIYYKYLDGLLFIIDPCTIPAFGRLRKSDIEQVKYALRPSILDIMQTYERMKQMVEDSVGLQTEQRYRYPIAVVVTKTDALGLEDEIGSSAAHQLLLRNTKLKTEDAAMHALVRDFLCKYELDHFVRELELRFANVHYFSCSALGRLPTRENTTSFVPVRVAEPLAWLLSQTKAVKPLT